MCSCFQDFTAALSWFGIICDYPHWEDANTFPYIPLFRNSAMRLVSSHLWNCFVTTPWNQKIAEATTFTTFTTSLHPWRLTWNISSWRFGSDHFPFYINGWFVGSMLIFQGVSSVAMGQLDRWNCRLHHFVRDSFTIKGFWTNKYLSWNHCQAIMICLLSSFRCLWV